jgi:hypothetical protein
MSFMTAITYATEYKNRRCWKPLRRDCGAAIAKLLGATKIKKGKNRNECLLNGKKVVIKCARSKRPQQVGATQNRHFCPFNF